MSIQAPQGILNIPNATLRVGKLSVDEVVGADTILNTVARNTILLVDDVAYHENKNWSLKLPNAWAGEFECNTASAGNYSEFNFYNEGASSNAQGYNLTFNDTTVELRYDGGQDPIKTGTLASTVTGTGVKKVRLMFERTILSVTVDGVLVFTHDDTGGPRPRVYSTTAGGFLNFFTNGGAIKNLKIVNEKWMSDGTSNIAYVGGGEVAVGKALAFNRVSNVSQIKVDSNVVTEYTGPHDRPLREYPEINMTTATTGGYTASASIENNTTTHAAFNAFTSEGFNRWQNGGTRYDTNSPFLHTAGESTTDTDGTSHLGDWIQLQLPNKINLSRIRFSQHSSAPAYQPKSYVVLGSNDDTSWKLIHTQTNLPEASANTNYKAEDNFMTVGYYKYLRLVVKSLQTSANQIIILRLQYYGYEEGSGSLDTTLKSVYNVPATTGTQLEVYYDAKDLVTMPATVTDLAGGDQNGTVTGATLDTTYKAFVFDNSLDKITTTLPSGASGEWVHSVCLWFKRSAQVGAYDYLFKAGLGGTGNSGTMFSLLLKDDDTIWTSIYSYDTRSEVKITSNQWYHLAYTYTGGAWNPTNVKMYLNGEHISAYGSDTNPLTLSGTNLIIGQYSSSIRFNGSIANFRLYSKALNADQIKELYDYQKDYFLGSKSQVTLYKGHLGVGVTEPSGQLELAGDERIQEYPPRAMTGYETLVEGHGVFCASASSYYNYITHLPWQAFTPTSTTITDGWNSGDNSTGTGLGYYAETASGEATSAAALFEGTRGEWVQLKCPYPIIVKKFAITGRSNGVYGGSPEDQPKSGILYGSNDGNNWDILANFSGLTYGGASGGAGATGGTEIVEVNATKGYTRLVLQATARVTNYGTDDWINIGQLRYFGTPGPTTLDKGSLTLGRSLDVPRVSRYDVDTETPRPEKLVVDFDTTVNSSPTDISGKGNHGVMLSGASYSAADKAFDFNATSSTADADGPSGSDPWGSIETTVPQLNGAQEITFSGWFKLDAIGVFKILYLLGRVTRNQDNDHMHWFAVIENGTLRASVSGGGHINVYYANTVLVANRWYHISYSIPSGTSVARGDVKVYLDGVEQVSTSSTGSANAIDIGDTGDAKLYLGWQEGSTNYFAGQVSNFKIYNAFLEPSEVKKLYNLGRTGRSMVISDTAVGIGKVPEANLDVRGSLAVRGGNVMIGQDNIQVRLATDPGYLSQISGGSMFIANPSTSGGYEHFIMNNTTDGDHQTTYFSFRRGGQIGSILTTNGSTISYNTGSDYRLKENIVDMPDVGLEIINKLRPKTFNFKKYPGETVHGFIAHELQEHIPIAVSGEKDEMRGEEPMYQGVDASKIVPWLVKATQELYEENQTLKTRLDTLEGA